MNATRINHTSGRNAIPDIAGFARASSYFVTSNCFKQYFVMHGLGERVITTCISLLSHRFSSRKPPDQLCCPHTVSFNPYINRWKLQEKKQKNWSHPLNDQLNLFTMYFANSLGWYKYEGLQMQGFILPPTVHFTRKYWKVVLTTINSYVAVWYLTALL